MLIISHKSTVEFKEFLKDNKLDFIETIDNPNLDPRIADHPDLSIFPLNENDLSIDSSVINYYQKNITDKNLIPGESVSKKYPYDAIYNVYKGSAFYIHNDVTEKNINNYMKVNNYKHLFTNQGYTRCSIIPMGDKILTADFGIYKTLKDKIEVILLRQENIPLDGFDEGFLGGTCGFFDKTLIFNGNIEKLSNYETLKKESEASKIRLLYPKNCDLVDTGSILFI
ncbi:DUF6873 family GME fold protein [Anaerococcus sp. ENR1011]|uniref:DUF6873 family GME fold protein n=1 Tax=Anaerococcus groningensis TaxID=3115616 RepID=A0ABW9N0D3_9FIRM